MTTRYSLNLRADAGNREPHAVMQILREAVSAHGVRRPISGEPTLSGPVDAAGGQLTLYFEVLADDTDELRTALATIVDGLRDRGLIVTEAPSILAEHREASPSSNVAGVRYDGDQQLLEVQTWAPDQHDLQITLMQGSGPDEVVALLASTTTPGRTEASFIVRQLVIGRPAGPAGSPSQPDTP